MGMWIRVYKKLDTEFDAIVKKIMSMGYACYKQNEKPELMKVFLSNVYDIYMKKADRNSIVEILREINGGLSCCGGDTVGYEMKKTFNHIYFAVMEWLKELAYNRKNSDPITVLKEFGCCE